MTATLETTATGTAQLESATLNLLRSAVAAVESGSGTDSEPMVAEVIRLVIRVAESSAPVQRIAADHGLSGREVQVLELVARGYSVSQIAAALFVTASTATFHLGRIYAKTGVHTRHELTGLVWGERGRAA